jgi:hypothetical protein
MNPEIDFLYAFEAEDAYRAGCDYVFAKYAPVTEEENTIVSHIAIATWLRLRFARTMHGLMRQVEALRFEDAPDYARIARTARSMARFHKEYRRQKAAISACRAALKRLRNPSNIVPISITTQEKDNVQLAA